MKVLAAIVLLLSSLPCNSVMNSQKMSSRLHLEYRRHTEAMASIMQNMTVESAAHIFEKSAKAHPELVAFVQDKIGHVRRVNLHGSSHLRLSAGAKKTGQAVEMIDNMIYETQVKYETENKVCCDYEDATKLQIESIVEEIAQFNGEAAQAAAGILGAQAHIKVLEPTLDELKAQLDTEKLKCTEELSMLEQEKITAQADLAVMEPILNMTRCADASASPVILQRMDCDDSKIQIHHNDMGKATGKMSARAQQLMQSGFSEVLNDCSGPCTKPSKVDRCVLGPGSNCDKLQLKFARIQADLLERHDTILTQLNAVSRECVTIKRNINTQIRESQTRLNTENTKLAAGTEAKNNAQEQSRLKTAEKEGIWAEYGKRTTQCQENYKGFELEECGLKKIRAEIVKLSNQSQSVVFGDCQLSPWTIEECSASCGGGVQILRRSVTMAATNGVKCLPLERQQNCNVNNCPIDCVLNAWEGWGECTAECGAGVKQRSRSVAVMPEFDGEACGQTEQEESCNAQSCNQDCQLSQWEDWSTCSKECGGGEQTRVRVVEKPATGTGNCPASDSDKRIVAYKTCNTIECPKQSVCKTKADIVLLMDGSEGLKQKGFDDEKNMTKYIINKMFGDGGSGVQMAVLLVGGPKTPTEVDKCLAGRKGPPPDISECGLNWLQHLTSDKEKLLQAVETSVYPESTYFLSYAMDLAATELTGGRSDAAPILVRQYGGYGRSINALRGGKGRRRGKRNNNRYGDAINAANAAVRRGLETVGDWRRNVGIHIRDTGRYFEQDHPGYNPNYLKGLDRRLERSICGDSDPAQRYFPK